MSPGLKQQVVAGALWVGVGQTIRVLITFGTVYVLARVLSPSDFGIIALIVAIALAANQLGDFGLGAVAVQKPHINDYELSTIFWFNIVMSGLVALIVAMGANWIANILTEPALAEPLRVSSLIFPLTTVRVVHRAILDRNLAFGKTAAAEATGTVAGSCAALSLAYAGAGVWSLVFQQLAIAGASSIAYIYSSSWQPRFYFSASICRKFLRAGAELTIAHFLGLITANVNRPIISTSLGVASLGYYNFALQFVDYPMRNISLILQRLIFPILSRVQDENERMKNIHMQMIHMIASILTPIVVVIYFAGDDLIKVSFGEKWAPVVPFLYIIAMISLIGTLSVALKGAFLATGNTKVIMRVNALEALASTTGIAVGVIFGLTGVAVGQLLALILTFIVNLSMMMRHVGHRITDILSVFARIFASNAILYGVLFVMEYISILDLRSGVFLRLFVGAATYVLAIFVVDREIFTFVREAVREVRARGGGRIPRNSG